MLAGALGFSTTAAAAYPDHAIKMVVGFSAGGTTDTVARIMAKEIGDALGQTVVVDNRPGAGRNLSSEMVARAAPDGYTLYLVAVSSAINQPLSTNIRFNLIEQFKPVDKKKRVM